MGKESGLNLPPAGLTGGNDNDSVPVKRDLAGVNKITYALPF